MPVPYCLSGRFTDSDTDTDTEDIYFNKDGLQYKITHGQARKKKDIMGDRNGEEFKCEKCDVRFFSADTLHRHMLGGAVEDGDGKHYYCAKCRVNFRNEGALKRHKIESSEHVVCRECSHEFAIVEALELHCKQVHKPKPETTHPCPGCDLLFNTVSGIAQHIESGQCLGNISPSEFRELVNYENTPLAKQDLPTNILAGSTTTHTWRAGIIPQRVKAALAETGSSSKPEKLVPKGFVSVLDYTIPAKPSRPPVENLREHWNEMFKMYVCPRPKCGKKLASMTGLKAHLESNAHEKKLFRCPSCYHSFVSSSALIQHAESESCGIKRSPAYKQLIKGATGGLVNGDKKPEYKTGW
ncbi:hypothetical protein C7212DRAFT_365706 [Tuber magnatum]|uniref:C2H2-type domain-containing protein n=1 Tax=Tuber magnatum TaxID=42249 RepID=A0A317SGS9_9PEZI|nr:hypothetical protein C7212DRAFT_365706 [Tuber magnatum]